MRCAAGCAVRSEQKGTAEEYNKCRQENMQAVKNPPTHKRKTMLQH